MRDDVKILLASLQEIYETKLSLLENLHKRTSSKLYYCKSGDYTRLSDSIEEDNDTFEKIDILDYNGTRVQTELSRIMGIRPASLFTILGMGIHPSYRTLLYTIDALKRVLAAYARDHAELVDEMERKKSEIEKARRSLLSHLRVSKFCRKHSA